MKPGDKVRRKPLKNGSYLTKDIGVVLDVKGDDIYLRWGKLKATYRYPASMLEPLDTNRTTR